MILNLIYCYSSRSETIISDMWVGLTDKGHEENWTFTDGTTLPEGVMLDIQNGGSIENCGLLYSLGLDDFRCTRKYPTYVWQRVIISGVICKRYKR